MATIEIEVSNDELIKTVVRALENEDTAALTDLALALIDEISNDGNRDVHLNKILSTIHHIQAD